MLDDALVDDYLLRIGAARPSRPDLAALRDIQERQFATVPFENLDYHLDEPIHLDERVVEKIVRRRRGGGCYELNPALAYLLRALGYTVDILPGRVYRYGNLGPPMAHLVLRVDLDGQRWLVDTGFGKNSRQPLRFDSREVQEDPNGRYQLHDVPTGEIDVHLNGKPLYRLDPRPCAMADFGPTLWWYRSCPDSPFLQDLFCSLPTESGRVTLKGNQLIRVENGERHTEELTDEAAVRDAYAKFFGFTLERLPTRPDVDSPGIQLD
jgi:N-hydroxyarylamine O-acetyltransferase